MDNKTLPQLNHELDMVEMKIAKAKQNGNFIYVMELKEKKNQLQKELKKAT